MANVIRRISGGAVGRNLLPSAARTATPDTQEIELSGGDIRGVVIFTDVTAITDTPSITVNVLGVDRTSGKTWPILAGAALTSVSTQALRIGPGLTAAANSVANDLLPPVFRINVVHGDADSITYSVAAHFCL